MAKYFGQIGYYVTEETRPGIWESVFVERDCYGDEQRNLRRFETSSKVNDDLNINLTLSVVADPFAYNHFHEIKYATYRGVKWKVTTVEPQFPRLLLTLGGVFNGEDME